MGIKFGEIDAGQILHNEMQISVLGRIIESILSSNPIIIRPDQEGIKEIRKSVVAELQKKYPKSGITYRET